jgi:hypothetical protein
MATFQKESRATCEHILLVVAREVNAGREQNRSDSREFLASSACCLLRTNAASYHQIAEESRMARSRNVLKSMKGKFTRGKPKTEGRGAGPVPLDKMAKKLEKLPEKQREALEGLELGARYAGRTFKRAGSQRDTPTVRRRPPMPNESDRTDMDRRGGRKRN